MTFSLSKPPLRPGLLFPRHLVLHLENLSARSILCRPAKLRGILAQYPPCGHQWASFFLWTGRSIAASPVWFKIRYSRRSHVRPTRRGTTISRYITYNATRRRCSLRITITKPKWSRSRERGLRATIRRPKFCARDAPLRPSYSRHSHGSPTRRGTTSGRCNTYIATRSRCSLRITSTKTRWSRSRATIRRPKLWHAPLRLICSRCHFVQPQRVSCLSNSLFRSSCSRCHFNCACFVQESCLTLCFFVHREF